MDSPLVIYVWTVNLCYNTCSLITVNMYIHLQQYMFIGNNIYVDTLFSWVLKIRKASPDILCACQLEWIAILPSKSSVSLSQEMILR